MSSSLVKYLHEWSQSTSALSILKQQKRLVRTKRFLNRVIPTCDWWCLRLEDDDQLLVQSITLSAAVLVGTLKVEVEYFCWRRETKRPTFSGVLSLISISNGKDGLEDDRSLESGTLIRGSVGSSKLLRATMLESGWCPYQVKRICRAVDLPTAYYLSLLRHEHGSGSNHQSCSNKQCVANNVDESQYSTKHADDCSGCEFLAPSPDEITSAIGKGGIPLIRCTRTPQGGLQLGVIENFPGVQYVAVSHVWSDGLGHPTANALPTCQLERLNTHLEILREFQSKEFASNFPLARKKVSQQPIVFWMDTLCIPVGAAINAINYRKVAIGRIAQTFAGASAALVLDKGLENISYETFPLEELCAQISMSAWMSRCWTFQEAILTQRCFVRFLDGVYDVRKIYHSANLLLDKAPHRLCQHVLYWLTYSMTIPAVNPVYISSTPGNIGKVQRFAQLWDEILERSTSTAEDKYTCLAISTNLYASEILGIPERQERLKAILRAQEVLPLSILFTTGPRLQPNNPKNRWAPALGFGNHLLSRVGYVFMLKNRWEPLRFGYSLFRRTRCAFIKFNSDAEFVIPREINIIGFLVSPHLPRDRRFSLIDADSRTRFDIQLRCPDDGSYTDNNNIARCILFAPYRGKWVLERGHDHTWEGPCLTVHRREDGVVYARFDCPIVVALMQTEHPLNSGGVSDSQEATDMQRRASEELRFRFKINNRFFQGGSGSEEFLKSPDTIGSQTTPEVSGERLHEDTEYRVECGKPLF